MKVLPRLENATTFVEDMHEATRLYVANRRAWGIRVTHYNNNPSARARLVDVPKPYVSAVLAEADMERPVDTPLTRVMHERKSQRRFSDADVEIPELLALLSGAVMAQHGGGDIATDRRRPYPSAGGIYAVEHYVLRLGLSSQTDAAVYYCDSQNRRLLMVNAAARLESLREALGIVQPEEPRPAFAIIQTVDLDRATRKYQERGYRFALLEAGCAAQSLSLLGADMGLASTVWGGFHDNLIDRELGISGSSETAINAILFGKAAK